MLTGMKKIRRLAIISVAATIIWVVAGAALLWPRDTGETSDGAGQTALSSASTAGAGPAGAGEPTATRHRDRRPEAPILGPPVPPTPGPEAARFAIGPIPSPMPVDVRLRRPPAAGLLFDVDTGKPLWARHAGVELPIASLTKMMTALVIAERHRPDESVAIGRKAPRVEGSKIGVLRAGTAAPLRGLFLGLLMASGNDAAVALAQHDAGTVAAFVARMNRRAARLGLGCTRFTGPAGLQDAGNYSCARDLGALARADLANPWIASITSRRRASTPFPTKGGRLSLANNHFFVQRGIAGLPAARVTGLKTGLTNGAGRCYVTTAELGGRSLGVVLLDSPDPLGQVPKLLRRGFAYESNQGRP